MYCSVMPSRVRVLILGGGIHGVGVLHDMVSRGWKDVHLLEKGSLAEGTSSKSTKLIHGGLRYLKRVRDFSLVYESLRERSFLLSVASDIVQPLELLIPVGNKEYFNTLFIKTGLFLYDFLAGKQKIKSFDVISIQDALQKIPLLNNDPTKASKFLSFWDAQTDDMALVYRVAALATQAGAQITEKCLIKEILPNEDGWKVTFEQDGKESVINALYVVNCLGPWSNKFLEKNHIKPKYQGFLNKGIHILAKDLGLKSGLFLTSLEDNRVVFVLPWCGNTLIGTTEEEFVGDPDQLEVREDEINYLLKKCNAYFKKPIVHHDIIGVFAGLRWLAFESKKTLTMTSREAVIGEHESGRGLLFTLYGGKLTSYRSLTEKIGDKITTHFGEFSPSKTHLPENWVLRDSREIPPNINQRFKNFAVPHLK